MAGRTVRVAIQCGALNSDLPFKTTCVMFKIKGVISCKGLTLKGSSQLVCIAALLLFSPMELFSSDNIRVAREVPTLRLGAKNMFIMKLLEWSTKPCF